MVCGPELSAPRHDLFVKKWGPPKNPWVFPASIGFPMVSIRFVSLLKLTNWYHLIAFFFGCFGMFWIAFSMFPYVFLWLSLSFGARKTSSPCPPDPRIPARSAVSHGGDEVRADAESVGGVGQTGWPVVLVMVSRCLK
jgi:hypothetical protein